MESRGRRSGRSGWRAKQRSISRSTGHDCSAGVSGYHERRPPATGGPNGPAGVPDRQPMAEDLAGHRRGQPSTRGRWAAEENPDRLTFIHTSIQLSLLNTDSAF